MSGPIHFAPSPFTPAATSFFGLSLGYVIFGGEKFFKYPPETPASRRALGIWALYGPGIVQSVSALVLLVGLTWFDVFERRATNYVLALAFLAFAAHWVAMGVTRIRGASTELEAWMGIPLAAVAALAAWTFFAANNTGYAIGFGLLFCVYVADSLRAFHAFAGADRVQGAVQFVTGLWMIYLTYAVVLGVTR